jgi:hypothetical protein
MKFKPYDQVRWYDIACCVLFFLIALYAASTWAQTAGTLTLNLSQTTRSDGKVDVSLTWSTQPSAKSCESSGAWTGSRSVNRSTPLVFTAVTPPADYTLTCLWDDPNGLATLTWIPPTENTDGSPLTNLAGYRIYYGTSATQLGTQVAITDPAIVRHEIKPLVTGTWFFAMTALNTAGTESVRSATVSKVVTGTTVSKTVRATVAMPNAPSGVAVN